MEASDMTREEVLRAIQNAEAAVRQYRQQNLTKTLNLTEQQEKQRIEKASKDLVGQLRESYLMGPGGSPCPRCGGSGTV